MEPLLLSEALTLIYDEESDLDDQFIYGSRSVCEKFDVGKATAIRAVRRVSNGLHCLASRFIQWPKEQRANDVMAQFVSHNGFPQVIGAIDGKHIKIPPPKEDAVSFINRKGYLSIHVQVTYFDTAEGLI